MDFSIKFDTFNSGWSIVYVNGSKVIISKEEFYFTLKIYFLIANSPDPDEMPHSASFHLGYHCLNFFYGFPLYRGLKT